MSLINIQSYQNDGELSIPNFELTAAMVELMNSKKITLEIYSALLLKK
jgi:hypothetical protein